MNGQADWQGNARSIKLGVVIACAVMLAATAFMIQRQWREQPLDLIVYWEAGQRMRAGGLEIYAPAADVDNKVGRYIYPPAFAAIFAPMTFFSRDVGFAMWGFLQVVVIACAFAAMRGLCGVRGREPTYDWLFWCMLALVAPLTINVMEGQVNVLVLTLIASGLWLVESGKPLRGGMLVALAVHVKVLPLALLPVLIVQRRWRAAAGVALGLAVFTFLPMVWTVPVAGPIEGFHRNNEIARIYVADMVAPQVGSQAAPEFGGSRAPNNSLAAVSLRWFGENSTLSHDRDEKGPLLAALPPALLRWVGPGIGLLMYALALALGSWRRQQRLQRVLCVGLAFVAVSIGHLLCWMHHLVALLWLVAPLAASPDARWRKAAKVVSVTLLVCIGGALSEPSTWLQIIGLPTLGALAAWGVALTVISKYTSSHEETRAGNSAA